MRSVEKWLGPLSGLLFVGLVIISLSISGGVDTAPSDGSAAALDEFRGSGDDIRTGTFVGLLGIGLLVVFAGYLRVVLRGRGAAWAADGLFAGTVLIAGAWMIFSGAFVTGAEAGDNGHTEVAQAVVDFSWNGTILFTPGLLAVGLTAATASFATRALPLWLGGFAVLVALGALAPWMGIVVFVAWVGAAAVAELVGSTRTQGAEQAAPVLESA